MPVLRARSLPVAARGLAASAVVVLSLVAIPGPASAEGSRSDVDRYLDTVADAVAQPGVYVDPAVLKDGALSGDEVTTLTRLAAATPGPVRILVLPVERLTVDEGGRTGASLAYRPDKLVKQIYGRVDGRGTYAVLVSAPSKAEGYSFYATQWARGNTKYDIENAAARAIACCPTDAEPLLRRFLKGADDRLKLGGPGGSTGGGSLVSEQDLAADSESDGSRGPGRLAFVAITALAVGLGAIGLTARRRSGARTSALDADTATSLRSSFAEELEELRLLLDGFGPSVSGDREGVDSRLGTIRLLLEQGQQRLASLRSSTDAQSVARTLADARFEFAAAAALRDNRTLPTRTPPCFVDPRHGLSAATMVYPASGLSTPVPVCQACQAGLEVGQEPHPRTLSYRGAWSNHWLAGAPAWVYLHGYWAGQPFMHHHYAMPPAGWMTPSDDGPAPGSADPGSADPESHKPAGEPAEETGPDQSVL